MSPQETEILSQEQFDQEVAELMNALHQELLGHGALIVASSLMNLLHHCAKISPPEHRAEIGAHLAQLQAVIESMDAPRH